MNFEPLNFESRSRIDWHREMIDLLVLVTVVALTLVGRDFNESLVIVTRDIVLPLLARNRRVFGDNARHVLSTSFALDLKLKGVSAGVLDLEVTGTEAKLRWVDHFVVGFVLKICGQNGSTHSNSFIWVDPVC